MWNPSSTQEAPQASPHCLGDHCSDFYHPLGFPLKKVTQDVISCSSAVILLEGGGRWREARGTRITCLVCSLEFVSVPGGAWPMQAWLVAVPGGVSVHSRSCSRGHPVAPEIPAHPRWPQLPSVSLQNGGVGEQSKRSSCFFSEMRNEDPQKGPAGTRNQAHGQHPWLLLLQQRLASVTWSPRCLRSSAAPLPTRPPRPTPTPWLVLLLSWAHLPPGPAEALWGPRLRLAQEC